MPFFKKPILLIMLVVIIATLGSNMAVVYEVGDSSGWTFNYNYEQWAASKNFQLGDILIFNYDPQLHNVRQVDKKNYDECTDHNPIASFYTGSDSVTLETPGLFYFICDMPGHCASGLKVHIKVDMPRTPPAGPEATSTPPTPDPTRGFRNIPGYPAKNPAASSKAYSSKSIWLPMNMLFTLFLASSMFISMV